MEWLEKESERYGRVFFKVVRRSWKGKVRGVEKFDPVETTSSNTIAKFSGNAIATIVTIKWMSFNRDPI